MANKSFISKILNAMKEWGAMIISIIAFIWTCIQLSQNDNNEIDICKWLVYGGLALLLISIISIWNNWPKKKCSAEFSPGRGNTKIKIIIQKGSVLKQKGIKVIHVQDTFETSINKCEKQSLLHAFLSLKHIDKHDLDKSIEESLKSTGYASSLIDYPLFYQLIRENMKTSKYDIGTVASYNKDYQLVAFSNIKDAKGNVEEKDYLQYKDSVNKVFVGLQKAHTGKVINQTYNVGVWGFQYNGGLYDSRMKIETMVRSFISISRRNPFCETLRICVNGKHAERIDFNKMQVLLEYIVDTTE
jgi:hypothetical protein